MYCIATMIGTNLNSESRVRFSLILLEVTKQTIFVYIGYKEYDCHEMLYQTVLFNYKTSKGLVFYWLCNLKFDTRQLPATQRAIQFNLEKTREAKAG